MDSSLASLVPAPWRTALQPALEAPGFRALEEFLDAEDKVARVFPPRPQIFASLAHTPPAGVKVVIVGQDPYPTAGNANGLAFSVATGVRIPGSLRNLFAGVAEDVGVSAPSCGDLTPWAKEGVLLLNTVLTVREGQPNSHQRKGWQDFTRAVLEVVNAQAGPIVFLCFGVPARKMAERLVDVSRHTILSAPHPSPLNGSACVKAIVKERPFTRINELLVAGGRAPVSWALP